MSRRVAEKFCGWNTSTLAEDAEFAAQCALAKERIAWAPDALIYDEAPVRFSTSLRQRRRWSSGVMEVARTCFGSLTRGFFRGGGMLCFDMMAFLSIPYMQLLGLLAPAVALLDGGFSPLAVGISLALCYAATAAGAGIVSLLQRSSGKTAFISALMFPLFMASWLPLVFLSLFNRATVWKEIRHGAAKRIEA